MRSVAVRRGSVILVVAGALFRLWATTHARFGGDEADFWATARRVATLEALPAYGASITGSGANHPGPMYYYLLALPQRLGASPYFGSAFVVLTHAFAAWLVYLFAQRAGRERAGLIALALLVFAPWDVLYADRIWGSCVVPPWSTVAIYAAARAKDSPRWQAALIVTALVLPQMHMSAPVVWAACLTLLVLSPPARFSRPALAVGLGLSLLAYAPPLYQELLSGFRNTKLILSESGGTETWPSLAFVPLKVFGYAFLYGTGEISYQFARGYWGGNFDDLHRYLTVPGWLAWLRETSAVEAALVVVSLVLTSAGWAVALFDLAGRVSRAIRARSRAILDIGDAMTIALGVALLTASVLMMLAKKKFFPHYANVLVPMLFWPVASGLDRLLDRVRIRPLIAAGLAATAAAMALASIRYYRTIDVLNGLRPTLQMVEAALEENGPIALRFDHFDNTYAWRMIAQVLHRRDLVLSASAPVGYQVHNAERFSGASTPPNGRLFDGVLLERAEAVEVDPPGIVFRAKKRVDLPKVEAVDAAGRATPCTARPDGNPGCAYGAEPWQHYAIEAIEMGGRSIRMVFMHPITGKTIRARYPRPRQAARGILRFGLSDAAVVSANQSPVEVRVVEGSMVLAQASAGNVAGLRALPFTVSSTAGAEIAVEITTAEDGARVFGFDLELY